ncbi:MULTISPECIES: ABC transporter ATP-binding protein [unclassified Undibacterium]|uniref:ABC transporter ATP-binding protein n=1 Tax=unclassified Undibacterium TaxID=2630295 RepID=UPI002AC90F5C|nr:MULTISPECIES: ABC transporter ATP-binding protein [unclassified Undibacterium]MEB0138302.1 ABC transporter ATP-binding protein [Undibacterium sp. CCC2.1]MEB0170788.1 ABC transporter ATP-binding protein [Undibacterium sp. CCC1.1]MEB0174677.1 ABC transporter ATP-binding protein [Undibacterium sp. CCC3.4]MEB0213874.1 ABC transporter ATP-binding protein [Undibacterium sp. 5I2]WPX42600.1 ABC transporter ATP-binding protein [Undibacterium sp. CCC3.4]
MIPLLQVENLEKKFINEITGAQRIRNFFYANKIPARILHALSDVSLTLASGEVLGVVGESGCGKSTLGRIIAGILPASNGSVYFNGQPVHAHAASHHLNVQMVFQNPYASLNPRMRIDHSIGDAAIYHKIIDKSEAEAYTSELLQQVGLEHAYLRRYPHQLSGGQRQRIAIARALALKPKLIVCDEAVSALDVSVQAQVLNLLMDLRERNNLSYLFISHNLAVVEYMADRVAVMYLGRVVELATTETLFDQAQHPYTQALIADAPRIDTKPIHHHPIPGELPSPLAPPAGCAFHPRCPKATKRCKIERPLLKETTPMHFSACHLNEKLC